MPPTPTAHGKLNLTDSMIMLSASDGAPSAHLSSYVCQKEVTEHVLCLAWTLCRTTPVHDIKQWHKQ